MDDDDETVEVHAGPKSLAPEDDDEDEEYEEDAAEKAMRESGFTPLQIHKCHTLAVERGMGFEAFLKELEYANRYKEDRFPNSSWLLAARIKKLPKKANAPRPDTGR